ncbi:hypothetical protein RRG08_028319 [Elysia crispata]|uniref:Uncharacterized protein n=1 Tax=Elysia crispata TaxID=231223 RepID=A0AAE1E6Y4_9GAST|nr:hypothetical protein RRG08_028319 [Elysia crispata]
MVNQQRRTSGEVLASTLSCLWEAAPLYALRLQLVIPTRFSKGRIFILKAPNTALRCAAESINSCFKRRESPSSKPEIAAKKSVRLSSGTGELPGLTTTSRPHWMAAVGLPPSPTRPFLEAATSPSSTAAA